MANDKYYRADHKEQRRTGTYAKTNCAAASGAMLVDQATLGVRQPRVSYFRKLTDDIEGGLRMGQIAAVMEEDFGMDVRLFDYRDNLKLPKLREFLDKGHFAVVAGDYDVIPPDLQGTDYDGFHAVVYHQMFEKNQTVGDPLLKGWRRWPKALAAEYVKKFDRQTVGGIHAVVMRPRTAELRAGVKSIEIWSAPTRPAVVIGNLTSKSDLVAGGLVKGDKIAGIDRWRRIWVPETGTFGYVHWTTTWTKY